MPSVFYILAVASYFEPTLALGQIQAQGLSEVEGLTLQAWKTHDWPPLEIAPN